MTDPRVLDPRRLGPISEALVDLPAEYPDIEYQLRAANVEFRRQSAHALEGPLNEFIRSAEPRTLEEHRRLAKMVDDTARHLGLCVTVDGEPGVPCAVAADPSTGRRAGFAVMVRGEDGGRPTKVKLDAERPRFSLLVAPVNVEYYLRPVREAVQSRGRER